MDAYAHVILNVLPGDLDNYPVILFCYFLQAHSKVEVMMMFSFNTSNLLCYVMHLFG